MHQGQNPDSELLEMFNIILGYYNEHKRKNPNLSYILSEGNFYSLNKTIEYLKDKYTSEVKYLQYYRMDWRDCSEIIFTNNPLIYNKRNNIPYSGDSISLKFNGILVQFDYDNATLNMCKLNVNTLELYTNIAFFGADVHNIKPEYMETKTILTATNLR